jgi:endonuclease III
MKRKAIAELVNELGEPYHHMLGIDLSKRESDEIFKWFIASVLFGARISETIAMNTYRQFERDKLLTPQRIIARGWSRLVESLDRGGYVRYDFKTATKFLELSDALMRTHDGDLNRLHDAARDRADLEKRLKSLKGIGDVTANIFLRELREVWEKAEPLPQEPVIVAARNLGLIKFKDPAKTLGELKEVWRANRPPGRTFVSFEVALLRLGRLYCKKLRCKECPVSKWCKR